MQQMIKLPATASSGNDAKPVLHGIPGMLLCAVLLMTLAACESEDVSDLHAYVQQVKARKQGRIPKLPKPKSYETYSYNESTLRDPFTPTRKIIANARASSSKNKPNLKRRREVLEEFPLDTLKMVGALEQSGQRWALIKSENGTLYRTRKGHYIGQDFGKIKRITETSIEISETVQDGLDGWVKRQTTLSVTE